MLQLRLLPGVLHYPTSPSGGLPLTTMLLIFPTFTPTIHQLNMLPSPGVRGVGIGREWGTQTNGWFFLDYKVVIPWVLEYSVLSLLHNLFYSGYKPLLYLLQAHLTSPCLVAALKRITQSCLICSQVSPQGSVSSLPLSTHQPEAVCQDKIGRLISPT
jgi:hypothetical protein